MSRYWYTVRDRYRWDQGWAFGDTPELAARDAVAYAVRWGGPIKGSALVYLQPDEGQERAPIFEYAAGDVTALPFESPDGPAPDFPLHMEALIRAGVPVPHYKPAKPAERQAA